MTKQQAINLSTTLLKTFLAACIAQMMTAGVGVLDLGAGDWKAVANAGIAALLVAAYSWLDPTDKRFGRGAKV